MKLLPASGTAKAKHRRGLLRVAAYFSFVTLACTTVSVRHARAEYEDQTLAFGRQMVDLAHASNHEITKLALNGQPVHVGSSVTEEDPATVLDRYDEYCKKNFGQTDDWKSAGTPLAPQVSANGADKPALAKAGSVRSKGDADGAVVCFAKGPKTKPTTAEAFESFMSTGYLGAFGELRYAYARKNPSGKTLVLTVWTDSEFNIREMIPEEGQDAPGQDFAEVPRVPNAQRVMSAKADGTPYGINVYKARQPAEQSLAFFDREMKAAGWFTYDPEMTESDDKGLGRAYMKDAVVLTVSTSTQGEENFVALGLAGAGGDDDRLGGLR